MKYFFIKCFANTKWSRLNFNCLRFVCWILTYLFWMFIICMHLENSVKLFHRMVFDRFVHKCLDFKMLKKNQQFRFTITVDHKLKNTIYSIQCIFIFIKWWCIETCEQEQKRVHKTLKIINIAWRVCKHSHRRSNYHSELQFQHRKLWSKLWIKCK